MTIYNFICNIVDNLIFTYRNMCECDGFKIPWHKFELQVFSKQVRVMNMVKIVQLKDNKWQYGNPRIHWSGDFEVEHHHQEGWSQQHTMLGYS